MSVRDDQSIERALAGSVMTRPAPGGTTPRASQQRSLLDRVQRLARIVTFVWDVRRSRVVHAGGRFTTQCTPLTRGRLTWRTLLRLATPYERRRVLRAALHAQRAALPFRCEIHLRAGTGWPSVLRIEAEPEIGADGKVVRYAGIAQDISEQRRTEERVRQLAQADALTSLANRPAFLAHLRDALITAERAHGCAVLAIGLDRFRHINDMLGHAVGDDLLVQVAHRLRAAANALDGSPRVTVARLGGDEFGVLITPCGTRGAERAAALLQQALQEPFALAHHECFISASVGLAAFPADGSEAPMLLRNADAAMRDVKSRGRGGWLRWSSRLVSRDLDRLDIESALHKALERGELELHYQPQIDITTGRVVGAEALMRWRRAGRLINAADFIPVAEDTGLVMPMGLWAIDEACRQARAWRRTACAGIPIAVNLTSRHFHGFGLVDDVLAALERHQLPPAALAIEITETGLMSDLQGALREADRLVAAGIDLVIDDFGTGYSSLSYLPRLPIGALKIDRAFIAGLDKTREGAAIVNAIVALGRTLDLRVIAEGVETPAQIEVLNRLGCRLVQGFVHARPMPAADFERWLTNYMPPATPVPTELEKFINAAE
ncbi:MAG TPA: EAL domain-containing protein [Burkholderiaceae bacterium]|nr:EAL domain-containing protein [Burkholderiaceae bacterium]